MINRFFTFAAKVSMAATLFMASGVGEWLKKLFLWAFDNSCDPDKFGPLNLL